MAHKKFLIEKSRLRNMYWKERLTSYQIARLFGCTPLTVILKMKEYRILRRNSGPKRIKIIKNTLIKLYVRKKLSSNVIARIYHCDQGVVLRALRRYNLTVRHPKAPIILAKSELISFYCNKKFSTYKIAKEYGCNPRTVLRYLRIYNISTRPKKHLNLTRETLINLYSKKKLSLSKIAKIYKCHPAAILGWMRRLGIPRRTISETSTKHPKKDFSGNLQEKAYMLGFRLGDLGIRQRQNLIYVSSSTTKDAQVKVIRDLFRRYGPVWIGKRRSTGAINVSCSLNKSFSFLIPKYQYIPRWVMNANNTFFAFLAGYTDAEGNIAVSSGMARFRIRTYDKGILYDCHQKLRQLGIKSLFGLDKRKGVDTRGVKRNKDTWCVGVNEKESLRKLLDKLEPILKHEKRRNDLQLSLNNLNARLKI